MSWSSGRRFCPGGPTGPLPCSNFGSPPASRSRTLRPASANLAATVPPPAPEPTTTYSYCAASPIAPLRIGALVRLERLQEFDQRILIIITQIAAEVMSLVDDKVGTFAELEHVGHGVAERLARIIVGCVRRQAL